MSDPNDARRLSADAQRRGRGLGRRICRCHWRLHGRPRLRATDRANARQRIKEAAVWKVAQPGDDAPRGAWWEAFGDAELDALEAQVDISNQTVLRPPRRGCGKRWLRRKVRALRCSPSSMAMAPRCAATRDRIGFQRPASRCRSGVNNSYNLALAAVGRSISGAASAQRRGQRTPARKPAPLTWRAPDFRTGTARAGLTCCCASRMRKSRCLRRHGRDLRAIVAAHAQPVCRRHRGARRCGAGRSATQVDAGPGRRCHAHARPARTCDRRARGQAAVGTGDCAEIPRDRVSRHSGGAAIRTARAATGHRRRRTANRERQRADRRRAGCVLSRADVIGRRRLQNSLIGSLLSLPSRYWSLGAALAQPIFDAGLRSAQKAQAIATYDETVANYRSTVLNGFQDVEDNLAALDLLAQEAAFQDEAVKAAQQSAAIAVNQYKAGTTSLPGGRRPAGVGAQQRTQRACPFSAGGSPLASD